MKPDDLLNRVKIASPCRADWNSMKGNDRARFCDQCQKNVFNLSAMTSHEAAALIRSTEGRLCVRLYRREDGTVLTGNCPVGVARAWGKVKTVFSALAVAVFGVGSVMGATEVVSKGREWLGINPSRVSPPIINPIPTMGKPAPIMGRVAMGTMALPVFMNTNNTGSANCGVKMGGMSISPPQTIVQPEEIRE